MNYMFFLIFTNEGEFQSVEPEVNKIDKYIKEKPIFAKDILKTNLKNDLVLKNHEIVFKEDVDNTYFEKNNKNQ